MQQRFKTYAVIEISTGKVIAQYLKDDVKSSNPIKFNNLDLNIIEDDKSVEIKKVNLSSTKGHLDQIKSPFNPIRCINNNSSTFTGDLVQIIY